MNHRPLQPLLHREHVVLRAPSQAWSAADGTMGGGSIHGGSVRQDAAIHGVYVSDVRVLSALSIELDGHAPEVIGTVAEGAHTLRFSSLARLLDTPQPDPGVRVEQRRTATGTGIREEIALVSRLGQPLRTRLTVRLAADLTEMETVKSGHAALGELADCTPVLEAGAVTWSDGTVSARLDAAESEVHVDGREITLDWALEVPARGEITVAFALQATDALAIVSTPDSPAPWSTPEVAAGDQRLERWLDRALGDLDGLRLETSRAPGRQFLAAGAPWFFTLFGRDSLWAARFLLPLGTELAGDTLEILAELQGAQEGVETAEQPGKIMHELRRTALEMPGEGIVLPPLYYGTVDATPLWVCLLHDAWRWGLEESRVRALLPAMIRALEWMRDHGDADGDGLLEYVDATGRGLSNQGWKDSGDSVQWRDGTLATGPIALCEVQAYAYEAATHAADLLDALGEESGEHWRAWAERLRARFHESFWIDDAEGPYPAIALDAEKRAVDTLTSNLGHLLGTGLLDAEQAELVARRLGSPALDSGYGLRTMATGSAGYWPLSYHGGSVWAHDTAIAVQGLAREGFATEAQSLAEGLLAAAEGFDYRMPELHAGESDAETSRPLPYPAACRPQAWSAGAAVVVLSTMLGVQPGADGTGLVAHPLPAAGARGLVADGIVLGSRSYRVAASAAAVSVEESEPLD